MDKRFIAGKLRNKSSLKSNSGNRLLAGLSAIFILWIGMIALIFFIGALRSLNLISWFEPLGDTLFWGPVSATVISVLLGLFSLIMTVPKNRPQHLFWSMAWYGVGVAILSFGFMYWFDSWENYFTNTGDLSFPLSGMMAGLIYGTLFRLILWCRRQY